MVKTDLARVLRMRPDRMRLVYRGAQLDDVTTLEHANVSTRSTIHLTSILRGGGKCWHCNASIDDGGKCPKCTASCSDDDCDGASHNSSDCSTILHRLPAREPGETGRAYEARVTVAVRAQQEVIRMMMDVAICASNSDSCDDAEDLDMSWNGVEADSVGGESGGAASGAEGGIDGGEGAGRPFRVPGARFYVPPKKDHSKARAWQ